MLDLAHAHARAHTHNKHTQIRACKEQSHSSTSGHTHLHVHIPPHPTQAHTLSNTHTPHIRIGTQVSDRGLSRLPSQCPQLSTLVLDRCSRITDQGVEPLAQLKHWTHLSCAGTDVSVEAMQTLAASRRGDVPCETLIEDSDKDDTEANTADAAEVKGEGADVDVEIEVHADADPDVETGDGAGADIEEATLAGDESAPAPAPGPALPVPVPVRKKPRREVLPVPGAEDVAFRTSFYEQVRVQAEQATRIQRWAMHRLSVKATLRAYERDMIAARFIQAIWRGFTTKRRVRALMQLRLWACCRIQAMFRNRHVQWHQPTAH